MLVGVCTIFLLFGKSEHNFEKFCDRFFKEDLSANAINLHYTLAHPENYGISSDNVTLPAFHPDNYEEQTQIYSRYRTGLQEINPEKLSYPDYYTYQLLTRYIDNILLGSKFPYYEEPLSPHSGMQSQLPILLAEYVFYDKQDIEEYLTILDRIDEYFEGLILFEQEKAKRGLLLPDTSIKKVISQCDTIVTKESLEKNDHFLQTTFKERLATLLSNDIITNQEYDKYIQENNRLLSTVVVPSYITLGDNLLLLCNGQDCYQGLSAYPEGKAYYEYLIRANACSYLSMEEIKALLLEKFNTEYQALKQAANSNAEYLNRYSTETDGPSLSLDTPEDILSDLQKRIEEDFPTFLEADAELDTNVTCEVKNVSPNLEEYSAPAFYLTPPLDAPYDNVIYINRQNPISDLNLYTTLAHEGYPGHLYQSVYSTLHLNCENYHPVRNVLWYGGYQEGWALYVEFLSYDYVIEQMTENGDNYGAYCAKLEKHNRNMQLCLYALLDIAIHYDNADLEQVANVLASFGIDNPATVTAIYEYIVEEPSNYIKYYLGYMEILNLKEKARQIWAESYTDYAFHKYFLECGPSDFATLAESLATSSNISSK